MSHVQHTMACSSRRDAWMVIAWMVTVRMVRRRAVPLGAARRLDLVLGRDVSRGTMPVGTLFCRDDAR